MSKAGRNWPFFMCLNTGQARIEDGSKIHDMELLAADFAFSTGPWLVRKNILCNLAEEIARYGYTGLDPANPRERAAIGIRADGMVVHCAVDSATLPELASIMQTLGCVNAINLDGGGSVGVIDNTGKVLIGYNTRHLGSALIIKDFTEPEVKNVELPPMVCIDPGHGRATDPGAIGCDQTTLEADLNLDIALLLEQYLIGTNFRTLLTQRNGRELRPGQGAATELLARCAVANEANADLFISIHQNSFTSPEPKGVRIYHWPYSQKGKTVANTLATVLRPLTGNPSVQPGRFMVLEKTDMPAILIECGFLSNPNDLALLKIPGYRDKIALSLAIGIMLAKEKGEF